MSTPFVYTLLPFDERGATELTEGGHFPTAGRTRWDFTLQVASVTSVTVVIQGAPVDDDDHFTTLGTFNAGAITAAGSYALTSYGASPNFTVQPYHEYLRAKVTAQTGDAVLEVTGAAAFLDPSVAADTALLGQRLRGWSDGLTRTVERAERDVWAMILHPDRDLAAHGWLDPFLTTATARGQIREMIAEQADWLEAMSKAVDDGNGKALADWPDEKPNLLDRIAKLRPAERAVWRGR